MEDRRVRRTRQRLEDALLELMLEKGYDKMTVQDLIDRADIGRSTFYAHYETKDDLLISSLERFTEGLLDPENGELLPAEELFEHLGEHHRLFRKLIGSRGIVLAMNAITDRIYRRARQVAERSPVHGVAPDVHASYLTGSLLSLVTWWLDHDMPYTPAEMAAMWHRLSSATLHD